MAGLAEAKRADPGEDVITDLVRAQADDEDFDYAEMVRLCVGLLFAGHETTVNRIGLGTLMLLTERERWDVAVADPDGRIDADGRGDHAPRRARRPRAAALRAHRRRDGGRDDPPRATP